MKILQGLFNNLPDGKPVDIRIGLHWTGVVLEVDGQIRCGLASTIQVEHPHHGEADIPQAGQLQRLSGRELAEFSFRQNTTLASVGVAALNALLPPQQDLWRDLDTPSLLARLGAGRRVVMIGRFPFVDRLKDRVGELAIIEKKPGPDVLPYERAAEVIAQSHLVAITSMTLLNNTLDEVLGFVPRDARVMLLGPTTPLTPRLFDRGIDILSGSVVTAIPPVMQVLSQAGTFRQVHPAGVRLVTMLNPELELEMEAQ